MSFEGEKKKKIIKVIFNITLIIILILFGLVKLFGGESKDKVFKDVENAISTQKTIEDVKVKLGELSSEKGIEYRINNPKDEDNTYKVDIRYDNEIKTFQFKDTNIQEESNNDRKTTTTEKDETSSTADTNKKDEKSDDTIKVDNILGSSSDVETKDNSVTTYSNEKSTDEIQKAEEREKETKANELYTQVKFSIENNKVIDTLEDDLKDIAKESKKKNIAFAYSIKDKLDGYYVVVTEINSSTHRDNFVTEEAKIKEKESKKNN